MIRKKIYLWCIYIFCTNVFSSDSDAHNSNDFFASFSSKSIEELTDGNVYDYKNLLIPPDQAGRQGNEFIDIHNKKIEDFFSKLSFPEKSIALKNIDYIFVNILKKYTISDDAKKSQIILGILSTPQLILRTEEFIYILDQIFKFFECSEKDFFEFCHEFYLFSKDYDINKMLFILNQANRVCGLPPFYFSETALKLPHFSLAKRVIFDFKKYFLFLKKIELVNISLIDFIIFDFWEILQGWNSSVRLNPFLKRYVDNTDEEQVYIDTFGYLCKFEESLTSSVHKKSCQHALRNHLYSSIQKIIRNFDCIDRLDLIVLGCSIFFLKHYCSENKNFLNLFSRIISFGGKKEKIKNGNDFAEFFLYFSKLDKNATELFLKNLLIYLHNIETFVHDINISKLVIQNGYFFISPSVIDSVLNLKKRVKLSRDNLYQLHIFLEHIQANKIPEILLEMEKIKDISSFLHFIKTGHVSEPLLHSSSLLKGSAHISSENASKEESKDDSHPQSVEIKLANNESKDREKISYMDRFIDDFLMTYPEIIFLSNFEIIKKITNFTSLIIEDKKDFICRIILFKDMNRPLFNIVLNDFKSRFEIVRYCFFKSMSFTSEELRRFVSEDPILIKNSVLSFMFFHYASKEWLVHPE